MIKYAGIGSRKTPSTIWQIMTNVGTIIARKGHLLRSGGAKGADTAFELGCDWGNGTKEIFRPADVTPAAIGHAAMFHPVWSACDWDARQLHARNSMIMLGRNLDDPVNFVVCWTPGGHPIGGTGQALRIATAYKIPVFNLAGGTYAYTALMEHVASL